MPIVCFVNAGVYTVVLRVEVLLAGMGWGVVELTLAVLVMTVALGVPALTVKISEKVSTPPTGSGPKIGGPLVWLNETSVVLLGSVSLKFTAWASVGPLFVTVILYVMLFPATAWTGPVCVTHPSAVGLTVVF